MGAHTTKTAGSVEGFLSILEEQNEKPYPRIFENCNAFSSEQASFKAKSFEEEILSPDLGKCITKEYKEKCLSAHNAIILTKGEEGRIKTPTVYSYHTIFQTSECRPYLLEGINPDQIPSNKLPALLKDKFSNFTFVNTKGEAKSLGQNNLLDDLILNNQPHTLDQTLCSLLLSKKDPSTTKGTHFVGNGMENYDILGTRRPIVESCFILKDNFNGLQNVIKSTFSRSKYSISKAVKSYLKIGQKPQVDDNDKKQLLRQAILSLGYMKFQCEKYGRQNISNENKNNCINIARQLDEIKQKEICSTTVGKGIIISALQQQLLKYIEETDPDDESVQNQVMQNMLKASPSTIDSMLNNPGRIQFFFENSPLLKKDINRMLPHELQNFLCDIQKSKNQKNQKNQHSASDGHGH
ncbi:MAG: hypothetical protein HQK50_14510 [Oligoflexia bacterium]|nr:hypothetical protein [Oligoflexia bacterium]